MRLLDCHLQNVRIHKDLQIQFAPGITVIGGENETGKSTLVEAIHRALFLKASATGAPIEALQSSLHQGPPMVQLAFEAKGESWLLRKRFSGSSGHISLASSGDSQPLSGPAAEELLAQLVGVKESLGSRQAGSILPTRWAHLWVMQGRSGTNLLDAGKDSYDFDALLEQMAHCGGAAVQQSPHDQRVARQIDGLLNQNFTSRGIRKHSPLWQRQAELDLAETDHAQALQRLEDYHKAGEEFATLSTALASLQNDELPRQEERRRARSELAQKSSRLEAAITLKSKELEPIRLSHRNVQQTINVLNGLTEEIQKKEKLLSQLLPTLKQGDSREQELTAMLKNRIEACRTLEAQRNNFETKLECLRALMDQALTREAIERLSNDLAQQQRNLQRRGQIEQKLAASPEINKEKLNALRDLEQRRRDAITRKQVMAAELKLLHTDQDVCLNGDALRVGETRQISELVQLAVGPGVVVEISPGGGKTLEDLSDLCKRTEHDLAAALSASGVSGLEAAAKHSEQRLLLHQELNSLKTASQQNISTLEADLNQQKQRAATIESQLLGMVETRSLIESKRTLPETGEGLNALLQRGQQTLSATIRSLQETEAERNRTRDALDGFRQARLQQTSQKDVLEAELKDRRQRIEALVAAHSSREALVRELEGWAIDLQKGQQELAELHAQTKALANPDSSNSSLAKLDTEIERLKQRIEQLIDQRGATKQRCESISAEDPFARVEQTGVQLEAARKDQATIQRRTEAQKLLQRLFSESQADLSKRYSEPLANAVSNYLRALIPSGPVAQLSFDQATGFTGLQLRRGEQFYRFDQLSGGMREQLMTALRLAMADVLKGGHDGSLPLVFDDAFSNSDPGRIAMLKQMLNSAVARGLQVVLLTCDPAAYQAFGDQRLELGKD